MMNTFERGCFSYMESEYLDDQPNQPNKSWKEGYVYLIDYGDGKTFKIGCTKNEPNIRLKQIQTGTVIMPMKLVFSAFCSTNYQNIEQLIHMKYDLNHVQGEWFKFGFDNLVEIWQLLSLLSDDITYHDRWFDLIPEDWDQYIVHSAIGMTMPEMAKREPRDHETYIQGRRAIVKALVECFQ